MLDLRTLAEGCPAITSGLGQYLAEAGAICLESQGHKQGHRLAVQGVDEKQYALLWPEVNDQIERCLNDPDVATEHGAVGIAILLAKKLLGYTAVQRSRKGTGFDYWLGDDASPPFQNTARLEVSGIRNGDDTAVKGRVGQKMKQTSVSDGLGLPAYIVVVEFGRPLADVRKR
ncbi:MAG TPA: hypothetical protein VM537_03390 [Anaerolineae bacterium]|nr:hypothetical protein [Anaerolineae bacterium]